MTDGDCDEMRLLIQADLDGELSPAEAAQAAVHVGRCPACAAVQADLLALSSSIRAHAVHEAAPWSPAVQPGRGAGLAAGLVLAACLALALIPPTVAEGVPEAVVAGHIRSLQPGHLVDVASTEQHTVKPWFDGRLAFAPPVVDLAADGFPLAGGRLDYFGGREVAALVYRSRQHVVQVFVWPAALGTEPVAGTRNGYNFLGWSGHGMAVWAVSDLNAAELARFARLWRDG